MQKMQMPVFVKNCKTREIYVFCVKTFEPIIRPVKHLKMNVIHKGTFVLKQSLDQTLGYVVTYSIFWCTLQIVIP